jgi:signal transduction histidine kinase
VENRGDVEGTISRQPPRGSGKRSLALTAWILSILAPIAVMQGEPLPLQVLWERSVDGELTRESTLVSATVLAADPAGSRLAVADDTGAALLELQLPSVAWEQIEPGRIIELAFPPLRFVRRGCRIDCGGGYLIEIDGRHPPIERRGSLFLPKGKHPFQLEWFNGQAASLLQLGLDGPGFSHESIPESWFSHEEGKAPGLSYERFRVKEITSLDEIPPKGAADHAGVASRIDTMPARGLENVALQFTGQLEVPEEGTYIFRLSCDDGARLRVGEVQPGWEILPGTHSASSPAWKEIGGTITYAAMEGPHLRLEIVSDQKRSEVMILNPAGLDAWKLAGRRITASGVVYDGGICVLAAAQVHFESPDADPVRQLALAAQVRELRPQDAARSQPVVIQGVVTMANYRSMVLQDESGGIFVLAESSPPDPLPEPGEWWRVEGRTTPGDFAPMIVANRCRFLRLGALPLPSRPSWEDILNGSLDAQQVEIEGIVIALDSDRAELLTRDGTAVIQSSEFYPLPVDLRRPGASDLDGARIKLRGVFATSWDQELGRRRPGVFSLGNASLCVVELAPRDPGEVPLVTVPDLWSFASKSTALNRVRLRGQMMARNADTLLVSHDTHTLRLASASAQGALPGDEVEVVGFARIGPLSPVIAYPAVRVLAHGALPDPELPEPSELPDLSFDGTLIRMEGRVISDTIQSGERRVELESESLRYVAVGPAPSSVGKPFLRDSQVRVDGVYFALASEPPAIGPGNFEIRMTGDRSLQLISRPSWWSTRRLLLLVAFLFGGLALVMGWVAVLQRSVRRRTSQLSIEIAKKERAETERALEQERARVARDLHDELGAGLTEIGLLGSLMGNPAIPATTKSGYVGTLGDVSRSLVSSLDEIVWAINPDYDTVDDLGGYLWLQAQRLLNPAGIECKPLKPVDIPSGRLGSRSRHSLLLAFKEALNNVIKHSGATHVDLAIRVEEENVVVSIADNGNGIVGTSAPLPGSQGISGMHERMHDHGGECKILTGPDGGTVVNLTLPLRSP